MSDILVDTNILVYTFDPRDRAKQEKAQQVFEQLVEAGRAVLSVQCLTEFFRTVRWRLPDPMDPERALLEVTRLTGACHVLDLTAPLVLEACRASNEYQMSIWDALIWAVAEMNGIPVILTEDADHDTILDGVHFLNPFHSAFDIAALEVQP
ncbi:MAG TPA: PIN domain-containing protein [Dehalococcoidia bacterium]|nr:PIN domain-containing protein [Dehalococcoidia bacterium]